MGVERTAEELGKAFPNTPIVQSSGTHVLTEVGEKPQLVLATPGAEPRAAFGYAAAILLDTGHLMSRPDLRAGEEALRRWLAVSALVRPASDGGTVLAVGDPSARPLQALVRMDPGAFAALELQERGEAGFPPAWKWITLEGGQSAIVDATEQFSTLPGVEVFGPVEAGDGETFRLALRAPLSEGKSVVASVKAFLAARSARKSPGHVRVRVDPQMIG